MFFPEPIAAKLSNSDLNRARKMQISAEFPQFHHVRMEMGRLANPLRRFPTLLGSLLLFALRVSALDSPSDTTLHGRVVDPSQAVILGASVSLRDATGHILETKTNRIGEFAFQQLRPGQYSLMVTKQGFSKLELKFNFIEKQNNRLDVSLEIAAKQEQVIVRGDHAELTATDPNSNTSALVIRGKDLDALSDDPDELEAELEALAGPAAGLGGSQFYINGFTGSKLPPKKSIREIRINQNPFSAEFDKLGFGRIELVTENGTINFHGRLGLEESNSQFNSGNPFISQKPDYNSVLSYANLTGPINKKASFLVTFEPRSIADTNAVDAVILDDELNPVPFQRAVANPKHLFLLNPALDYQISSGNTLSARYQLSKMNEQNDGPGQFALALQGYDLSDTEHDLQISDTEVFNPRLLSQTGFEYLRDANTQTPQSSLPEVQVLGAFTDGGSNLSMNTVRQIHYEVHDSISYSRANHRVQFGGRLRFAVCDSDSRQNFNGTFSFSSLDAYRITQHGLQQGLTRAQIRAAGGGASQFSISAGDPLVSNTFVDGAIFGQDDWKLAKNLMLSYGLRYEIQNEIHDSLDFAPRLGIAWGLGGNKNSSPKIVIRAYWGIFYDRFTQNLALVAARLDGQHTTQYIVQLPDFFPAVPSITTFAGNQTEPTVYSIDPNFKSPYTLASSVSMESVLGRASTLSVTYLHSQGAHQSLSRNINAPLPGTFDVGNPTSGVRPLGNLENDYQFQSKGAFNQNQLTTNLRLRAASWLSLLGYYSLNYAESNTAGSNSFPANEYDLNADYGRAAFDIRQRISLAGNVDLPYSFRMTPLILARSGQPYDITVGQDLNGDSVFNDRPAFATDLSRPSVVITPLGAFDALPISGEMTVPPNLGTGPAQVTFNLRTSKSFFFTKDREDASGKNRSSHQGFFSRAWDPQYSLRFDVVIHNLFNHVNAATPVGNLGSPLFGRSNAVSGSPFSSTTANRQIYFQVQSFF